MVGLRVTGWTLLSLGSLFVFYLISRLVGRIFLSDAPLLREWTLPLCMVLVSLFIYRFYGKNRWTFGWKEKHAAGNFVLGAISAIILVSIASTVILASSSIEVVIDTWDQWSIINQLLIILFTTVGYEIFFRGYLYSAVKAVSNMNIAVIVSSSSFSIVYILFSNSINQAPYEIIIIGFLNMFLLAILLSQARIYSGSLWMGVGLHLLFNLTQSTIFGYMYGGKQIVSFFTVVYISDSVLNGGKLGIEASIIWTPILFIAVLCFNKFIFGKNSE